MESELSQPGYKSDRRRQQEKQPGFELLNVSAMELKAVSANCDASATLDRCLAHGEVGMERWIGWGVIVNNLAPSLNY